MKTIIAILFIAIAFCAKAQDSTSAYKRYVFVNVCSKTITREVHSMHPKPVHTYSAMYLIPRYQIPKGSVFCRMEDKLNRATKVWIKVGTNNNK